MARDIPWRKTLGAKLGGIALALAGVSLVLIVTNIYMLASIQGESAQIAARANKSSFELRDRMLRWIIGDKILCELPRDVPRRRRIVGEILHRSDTAFFACGIHLSAHDERTGNSGHRARRNLSCDGCARRPPAGPLLQCSPQPRKLAAGHGSSFTPRPSSAASS